MMREDGDACQFLTNLAYYLEHHPEVDARHLLDPQSLDYAQFCASSGEAAKSRLRRLVGRLGYTISV